MSRPKEPRGGRKAARPRRDRPAPARTRAEAGAPRRARSPAAADKTSKPSAPSAIGIDTGGTFTDFVAVVGDRLIALKLPSTPRAPERAVLQGLARFGATPGTRVRHGSTVATNTLLERRGARVTFLTTEGFEDLLEIGRQDRPDLYALAPRRAPPLVPSERRIGVAERIGPGGVVWKPLGPVAARTAARRVAESRPQAVAIGLLHAYAAPAHERALGRRLAKLGVPVTLSSELCPEVRELERFSTTVVNAYLAPRVSAYLQALARRAGPGLEIVLSHGGTAPPAIAAREPARQLLSGPAAGLAAAHALARACGFRAALTLDVGGTSTDCAHLEGELPRRRAREVAGHPIQLPMLDVHTVGAGGGSIAAVDAGGLLAVGPQSAGARPGPACYGHGGPATVTDAMVVLGRIPHQSLGGGRLTLDRKAAAVAMEKLALALGAGGAAEAASSVARVAEARMAEALRRVSIERGHDPRRAALVAYGGAGGLHACALAEALDARAVLFPRHAGLLCAIGALAGGSRREKSRSVLLDAGDAEAIDGAMAELEVAARASFASSERSALAIERWAEVRYRGQSHELSVELGDDLAGRFHREHRRRFGFATPERAVQVVTLEVRAALPGLALPRGGEWLDDRRSPPPPPDRARVYHDGGWREAAVFERRAIGRGTTLRGPAVVLEEGATLWIAPGFSGRVHASGTVVLTR